MLRIAVLILLAHISSLAQVSEFPLWQHGVPGEVENHGVTEDTLFIEGGIRIRHVTNPTLRIYVPMENKRSGAAIIICPGGGYERLAMEHEGFATAEWLRERGITAFILKYRLPSDTIMQNKSIGPLADVQEAIRYVRRNAKIWGINNNRIGIMGFSAGGHLAAIASTLYADSVYKHDGSSARPDFSILGYPVISMDDSITHKKSKANLLGNNPAENVSVHYSAERQVNKQTPPAFIIHSEDDKSVPIANSERYYHALQVAGIPAELHRYKSGGHGYGLKGRGGDEADWPVALQEWLLLNGYIATER